MFRDLLSKLRKRILVVVNPNKIKREEAWEAAIAYHEATIEAIAHHEAGHAVADYIFGIQIDHVTINLEEDSLGHVDISKEWSDEEKRKHHEGNSSLELLNDYLALEKYCGGAAEAKYLGRKNLEGNQSDRAIIEISVRLFNSKETSERIIKAYEDGATRMMNDPDIWRAVQAVATALLKKRTLYHPELKEICDNFLLKREFIRSEYPQGDSLL